MVIDVYEPDYKGILRRISSKFPDQKELLQIYESRLLHYRKSTLSTKRPTRFSRGRLYLYENDEIFLVPTNFPTMNYLNLEEFAMSVSDRADDRIRPRRIANLTPLIDHSTDEMVRYFIKETRSEDVEDMATKRKERCFAEIKKEWFATSILTLLKDWSIGKQIEVEENFQTEFFQLCPPELLETRAGWFLTFRLFLDILISCCTDSLTLVATMAHKCIRCVSQLGFSADEFISPYEYILFRCHLKQANLKYTQFQDCIPERDLLSCAFASGDTELMKVGLELEWPSPYFSPVSRCRSEMWPRNDNSLPNEFIHSAEHRLQLSHLIVSTAMNVDEKNFIRCFQLLWRATPVPYLTIEGMQRAVDLKNMNPSLALLDDGDFKKEADRVWKRVADAFADDYESEFKPRSLKHLCRYAARRQFRSPGEISSLDIPRTLKEYLLLEC